MLILTKSRINMEFQMLEYVKVVLRFLINSAK